VKITEEALKKAETVEPDVRDAAARRRRGCGFSA